MTTEARFLCAVCGAIAGQVRLLRGGEPRPDRSRARADALADADALIRPADQAALVVDTFYGVASQPVSGERFGCVADAVAAADTAGLYALGYSYAPFHCPDWDAIGALANQLGGTAHPADLSDAAQAADLVSRVEEAAGPIDVLVNNAGAAGMGAAFTDTSEENARYVTQVNYPSPAELCRQAIPRMLGRGGGHIVNISSMAGCVVIPGTVAYSASKAALSHFAAGLRADLRELPIRTTLVELGPIPTDMLAATDIRGSARRRSRAVAIGGPRRAVSDTVSATPV